MSNVKKFTFCIILIMVTLSSPISSASYLTLEHNDNIVFSDSHIFKTVDVNSSEGGRRAISIFIDIDNIQSVTDTDFISIALDTSLIYQHWKKLDLRSKDVMVLAQALSPCYLRVGGTMADFLTFNDTSVGANKSVSTSDSECNRNGNVYEEGINFENFTMSAYAWDELNEFAQAAGWNMIFDLNVLLRHNGHWDPSNAITLLKYTANKGYKITGFELGNEPNAFNHTVGYRVEADQLAMDFIHLREILGNFPQFASSLIVGPDTTQVSKTRALNYFSTFLKAGGSSIVKAATFHHYYVDSRTATLSQFVNATVLDGLGPEIIRATQVLNETAPNKRVWLGETSSTWGGGAARLSDRYVAGFMWLDKLGVSAALGIGVVVRQSFYGGVYSLLNRNDCQPNPDYWLTVLYKTLVGRNVLNVSYSDISRELRLYAHCTNTQRTNYSEGAITVYGMNLHTHNIKLDFSDFHGEKLHIYLMEPENGDLQSRYVKLNGETLRVTKDKKIPNLIVPRIAAGLIQIPPRTFWFIVIPDAAAKACIHTNM